MPKIDLAGTVIHYQIDDLTDPWRDPGSVQTILMHHGFSRNHKFWTPWVATLARKYRVLRYDAPGFGESTVAPGVEMTVAYFVESARKLIDGLGIRQVHWIGVMSGGIIGQLFATAYPERIRSLVLCDSPHKILAEQNKALSGGYGNVIEAIQKLGVGGWRARTAPTSVDMNKANSKMLAWAEAEMTKTRTESAVAFYRVFLAADSAENLPRVKTPTLLLNGDRSKSMTPEDMLFMYRQIPNARLAILPNLGGSVDFLAPERCAALSLEFITEIDARP